MILLRFFQLQFVIVGLFFVSPSFAQTPTKPMPKRVFSESPRSYFVRTHPCPAGQPDCYFDYNHPNSNGTGMTQDFIWVKYAQPMNDKDVYIHYRSMNDTNCFDRDCVRTVPKEQVRAPLLSIPGALNLVTGGIANSGVDRNCSVCGGPQFEARQKLDRLYKNGLIAQYPILDPEAPYTNRYPISSAESFLKFDSKRKIQCEGRILLHDSVPMLLEAEQAFRIPAASIACLVGKESKWLPNAKSETGYMGLPQTREPNASTVQTWITPPTKKTMPKQKPPLTPYDPQLARAWNQFTNNMNPKEMNMSNMYRATPTKENKKKLAMVSIGFIGVYLNYIQQHAVNAARSRYGDAVANALVDSDTVRAMAYAGYNAGQGRYDDIVPEAAYKTPYWCKQLAAGKTPGGLPSGFNLRSKCGPNELSWTKQMIVPKCKNAKAIKEQAQDYIEEIHRCESSQWLRPLGDEALRQPKDECGLK